MRRVFLAILICLAAAGARAEDSFKSTEPMTWKQYQWTSMPLPVPKGWSVTTDISEILGKKGFRLVAIPPSQVGKQWLTTGFDVRRFEYGVPDGVDRDVLHLAYVKAISSTVVERELVAWEQFGGVRASLHALKGPNGEKEMSVVLSHYAGKGANYVMTAFAPLDEYEKAGSLAHAGEVFETLTAQKGLAEKVAAMVPREKLPAQSAPYTMSEETREVEWLGRTLKFPADWQVRYIPFLQGTAQGRSMRVQASPNFSDPGAPMLSYRREPGGDKFLDPQPYLVRLMKSATDNFESYTAIRKAAFAKWACVREEYKIEAEPLKAEFFCLVGGERDGVEITEGYALSAVPEDFERFGGARAVLLLTGEIPPDRLGENLALAFDPVKKLITTRAVPPFPALVPFAGGRRAPAGWHSEMSYVDGELRFFEPGEGKVRPTLTVRTRFDTGVDAEIALTELVEDYGIKDFALGHSDYLSVVNGVIIEGTGMRDGEPIKIGALAEKDHPTILAFSASPEDFDAMGGTSLLGPVFLGYPPDKFEGIETPEARVAMIAEEFGKMLAERRAKETEMKLWAMKTETESIIHSYRMLSLSMACGAWC